LSISALFSANSNLPAYSTIAASTVFEDKTKYFTLARMSLNIFQLRAVATLLNFYNWSRLAVLRSVDSSCDSFLAGMTNIFPAAGISLVGIFRLNFSDPIDMSATLQQLKITARIALICAGVTPDSALTFLMQAVKINMEYPDYVYIIPEYNTVSLALWQPWLKPGINSSTAASYIRAYKSAIVNNIVLSSLYNAMYLYGIALNKSFSQNKTHRNGDTLYEAVKGAVFTAACGVIRMNNNADRVPFFAVGRVDKTNATMETLMMIGGGVDDLTLKEEKSRVCATPIDLDGGSFYKKKLVCLSIGSRLAVHSVSESSTPSIGKEDKFKKSSHEVGTYNGIVVYSKKFKKKRRIAFNQKKLLLLKRMKELNNENIDPFIGLSVNDSGYLFSFWTYCQRGSLADVLFNEAIKMDPTFQASLIRDVVTGLCYLHDSPVGYHGLLYSKNCLIDNRWTVKLTNYGICDIYESLRVSNCIETHAHDDLPNNKIISMLRTLDFNGRPLRPSLQQIAGFDVKFLSILETCWQESPTARVNASALKRQILLQTKRLGKNLIDHVLKVLEQYANNLEKIIEERTEKMMEERRRADNLLYQILPRMVADSLKHGINVSPEVFDSATIYFSSIVGFASICSQRKPRDIVNILNGIYQVMDKTITSYDAYKVETINDSYLVVSGVPVKNGMSHTTAIADLSLELLQVISEYHATFQKNQLSLRIGLNCGPVAAGVIGIASPRYCLFGDTVNVASRIETNGEGKVLGNGELPDLNRADKKPTKAKIER
uniref:Guanylate cyclase n=1 Tax=Romanomermis culicivorax TaxID=13658 RepID=A0A915KRV3_ROMCU